MSAPVHIVALSARTAVGLSAEASAAAVRVRISRLQWHPYMVDIGGAPLKCAVDGRLDPKLQGPRRMVELASAALAEIAAKLTSSRPLHQDLLVHLALPESRPGHSAQQAAFIAECLQDTPLTGIDRHTVTLCGEGHAGALLGVEQACRAIEAGQLDLCVAGGVDSYFEADTLLSLDAWRRLAGSQSRSGFLPGEGASFVALASDEARRRLGLASLARVRGVATSSRALAEDASDDDVDMGRALTEAIARATEKLQLPAEAIGDLYCDLNGERTRTEEWGLAALRARTGLVDPSRYVAPTDCWGDLGAGSGGALITLATQAFARGYACGEVALIWCASDGALRGAVALQRGA